jgi:hypothetical protein
MTARNSESSLIPRWDPAFAKAMAGRFTSFSPENPWSLDFHYVSKSGKFVKRLLFRAIKIIIQTNLSASDGNAV